MKQSAHERKAWHTSEAPKWAPWPLWFGTFGNAAVYNFHVDAADIYGRAAEKIGKCIAAGPACDPRHLTIKYNRLEWQITRMMSMQLYSVAIDF